MACQPIPFGRKVLTGRARAFYQKVTLSRDPIWAVASFELPRILRVPPATANDDAFGGDLLLADQMLADDIDIIELAFLDRDQRRMPPEMAMNCHLRSVTT